MYQAMLDGRVSDLELGAILLAMRIKGESVQEIAGFLAAAEASFTPLHAPAGPMRRWCCPATTARARWPT
jgi:anthranilate phosphoribosyltransferase